MTLSNFVFSMPHFYIRFFIEDNNLSNKHNILLTSASVDIIYFLGAHKLSWFKSFSDKEKKFCSESVINKK